MPKVEGDLNAPLSALPEDAIAPIAAEAPEFQAPLPPIATFDVAPLPADSAVADEKTVTIRYTVATEGLDELGLRALVRGELAKSPLYTEFLASPEFQKWLSRG